MASQPPTQSSKEPEKKAPPPAPPHPEGRAAGGQETPPADAKPTETPPPEEKVLGKEDAMALFHGGHKLKKKGDPATKWFAATRAHGVLVIAKPVDEEVEKELNGQDLVLIPDA